MNCEYIKCIQREALTGRLNKKCDRGRAGQGRATSEKTLVSCHTTDDPLATPTQPTHAARQSEARRRPDEVNIERPFQLTCDLTAQASCKVSSRHSAGADQREQGGVEAGARLAHDIG